MQGILLPAVFWCWIRLPGTHPLKPLLREFLWLFWGTFAVSLAVGILLCGVSRFLGNFVAGTILGAYWGAGFLAKLLDRDR